MSDELLLRLGIALAIGLIIGLERGWRLRDEPEGSRVAGLRTFGLTGLLGGTLAAVSLAFESPLVLVAGFVAFAAIFAWYQERSGERHENYSVTGVIAGLAVFGLGALAVAGDRMVAAAGGVAVASILASRDVIHDLLRRLRWEEVRSALLLLAMTAIVLPILPNRDIDPWGGFNPFDVWLFTVLTAAVSFAGYVTIRIVGPSRGMIIASLLGALVSSTAVTLALGRRARVEGPSRRLVGGALLAATVSILRVTVLVSLIAPPLLPLLVGPAVIAAAVFAAAGAWYLRGSDTATEPSAVLGNPFDVLPLAIFALTFSVVSVASAFAATRLGPGSIIAASGLSAILDVDAASLSVARLAGATVPVGTAATAILVAVGANALGRFLAAAIAGPPGYWRPVGLVSLASVAAGGAVAILVL